MKSILFSMALFASAAQSAELIVSPSATLDSQDVIAGMAAQLGEAERQQLLGNREQLRRVIDGFYLSKVAAADARKNGLDVQPVVKARIEKAVTDILAQAQVEFLINKELENANFDEAAAEYYKANQEKFKTPEIIEASHILVKSDQSRDREAALKLVGEIREKVLADPSVFEEMARTHSDDKVSGAKGGALGAFPRKRMVKPFTDAAFKLKATGELSDVVETQFGFHLIRLDKPYVPGIRPFEEVKVDIIKKLTGDVKKLIREEYLISLRDSPDVLVNEKNIDAFLQDPLSANGSK